MPKEELVTNIFFLAATLGVAVFAIRACWFWQSSRDVMTTDELAGLSDGRSILDEVIEASIRQSAMIAKGAHAASIAAFLAACALIVHWL